MNTYISTFFHRLANFPIFIPRLQLDTLYARATNRINSIFVTRRAIIEAFDRGFRIKSETGRQKWSNFQR